MKNTCRITILLFLSIAFASLSFGQQHAVSHQDTSHIHAIQHHKVILFSGYSLITSALDENGQSQTQVVPLLGLNYEYWFNHKWGIGLQNELELANYVVEREDQATLERSYAYLAVVVGMYEALPGWTLFAGPGYEVEHHANFVVFKIGTDVSKSFEGGWGAGVTVSYDFKEVNSAIGFGIAISKKFGRLKK